MKAPHADTDHVHVMSCPMSGALGSDIFIHFTPVRKSEVDARDALMLLPKLQRHEEAVQDFHQS